MNLFLVVTASQFKKTKQRDAQLNQKSKSSNSSQTTKNSEAKISFWEELLQIVGSLIQKSFTKVRKLCSLRNQNNNQVDIIFYLISIY